MKESGYVHATSLATVDGTPAHARYRAGSCFGIMLACLCMFALPVAAFAQGRVVAWGNNASGQTSVPAAALENVIAIDAGQSHTLALKSDGSVIAWGSNENGEIDVPAGLDDVTAVSAGHFHSVALKSDGTVVAWGANNLGQSTVPAGLANVVAVAAGGEHTLALRSDGTVVAWGGNSAYGVTDVPAGLSDVRAIAANFYQSLALTGDGTVVAWGINLNGEANVPADLENVTAIAAGFVFSLALKSDGTVAVLADELDYWRVKNVPAGLVATAIAAGSHHALALKANGTVVAWGGDCVSCPDLGERDVPAGLVGVTALAAGGDFSVALVGAPVLTPDAALADLQDFVNGMEGVNEGVRSSLLAKLDGARAGLDKPNPHQPCALMQALINEAGALRGNRLTSAQADYLIVQAGDIALLMGCP